MRLGPEAGLTLLRVLRGGLALGEDLGPSVRKVVDAVRARLVGAGPAA